MKRKDSFLENDIYKSATSQLRISADALVFLFGWIGITSFIIANFHLQGNNIKQTESTEKFWYLTLLLTTWIILHFTLVKEKFSFKNSMLFQIIGLITAATGLINWVGDPVWHKGIWLGFEWPYLLIYALIFFTLLMRIMYKHTMHYKLIRVFIFLLSIYSIVSYIVTAWQDTKSISDKYSYSFVNKAKKK